MNRCDWGGCDTDPEVEGSAFCDFHAGEWERIQRGRHEEYWA